MDTLVTQIYVDFKNAITSMATSLGVTAENVYSTLIAQQYIKSLSMTIALLVCFIAFFVCIKTLMRLEEPDEFKSEVKDVFCGSILITSFIAGMVLLAQLNTIITGFLNPEYGAMQEIMDFIK